MATINEKFFSDLASGATWSAGVAFKRSNPLPLDRYSVFETKELAETYASSNAVAYPGQVIAVAESNVMNVYVLAQQSNEDGSQSLVLQPIAADVDLSNYSTTEQMQEAIASAIAGIPEVTATDDDVVIVEVENNKITASHAEKGPTDGTTAGAAEDQSIGTFGSSIEFKVPTVTVDKYGHTTALSEKTINISLPAAPTDTQYEMKYEEVEGIKTINLYNKNEGVVVSSIDATPFIKDGMLSDVEYDPNTNTLTFTWNTDGGFSADTIVLSDILDPYIAGDLIRIEGTTISHATVNTSEVPDTTNARKYITGITTDGHGHIESFSTATETVIDTNDTYSAGNGIAVSEANDESNHTVSIKLANGEQNLVLDANGLSTNFNLANYATTTDLQEAQEAIADLNTDLADEVDRATAADKAHDTAIQEAKDAAATADAKATTAQNEVDALELVVAEKVDKKYQEVPVIDTDSGSVIDETTFNAGTYYVLDGEEYVLATEYVEGATYYMQAYNDDGSLKYEYVAYTLLSPEDKEKLDLLVFDEDGGVSVSGNIHISQVQGLEGYLEEKHLSTAVVDKLNYITGVNESYFTVSSAHILEPNFIKYVDQDTFEISDVNTGVKDDDGADIVLQKVLQLKSVPAGALTTALGNLSAVPTVTLITDDGTSYESNTIVDNINNIYTILTWGEMA